MSKIISIEKQNINLYDISFDNISSYAAIRTTIGSTLQFPLPLIKKVKTINATTVSTDRYYAKRTELSKPNYKNHLYPIAVRYISKDNHFVIERPPFQLEVDFRLGSASSHKPKIPTTKVWIPWTVMVLKLNSLTAADFSSVRLYFNDGPISSLEDVLLPTWLPNSYNNGSICFSNSLNDFTTVLDLDQIVDGNLSYIYNYIFNNYMMGGWNSDLALHFNYLYIDEYVASLHGYPSLKKYNYPSKEDIKNIVSNYPEESDAKYIKKCLSSKMTIQNYRNSVNAYVKHFASLSALSLEETLSLITETKKLKINHFKKFQLSNILTNNNSYYNNRYSDPNGFMTSFTTSVMSNSSLDPVYNYNVTDNFVYFDVDTFHKNVDNGLDNSSICSNGFLYYCDNIFQYIGPKNLSDLEQFLISLNDQNISGKIIICSFDSNNSFNIQIASDDMTISTLLEPHKDRLKNAINSASGVTNNTKSMLTQSYSNFSTMDFSNVS